MYVAYTLVLLDLTYYVVHTNIVMYHTHIYTHRVLPRQMLRFGKWVWAGRSL